MSDRMIEEGKGPVKILIVDDDADVAEVLRELVSRGDRVVHVCSDGLKALEKLEKESYDLLILDLVMPGVDGLEVFKFAKKVNPEVLVIIITGYATLETAVAAIKEGAYDYIQKPFKLDGFNIAVDNAVEKVNLNRENRELLRRLQAVCSELTALKNQAPRAGKIATVNFLSSSMPSLHYLYTEDRGRKAILDRVDALISLKDKGLLSDQEFRIIKDRLFKADESS